MNYNIIEPAVQANEKKKKKKKKKKKIIVVYLLYNCWLQKVL